MGDRHSHADSLMRKYKERSSTGGRINQEAFNAYFSNDSKAHNLGNGHNTGVGSGNIFADMVQITNNNQTVNNNVQIINNINYI